MQINFNCDNIVNTTFFTTRSDNMDTKTRSQYKILAEFLGKTLGPEYEIVLHDINGDNHSIAYIVNGNISGRSIDDPQTDQTFKYIKDQTVSKNNYIINTKGVEKNNKVVRSSSLFIKDENNKLTGMLCINFNGSKYVNLAKQILKMTGMDNASIENEHLNSPPTFIENISSSISEATDNAVKLSLENSFVPVDRLNQEEKIEIVRDLEGKGVFMLKGAVSEVAEKLGVSEATLYRYIRIVSNEKK